VLLVLLYSFVSKQKVQTKPSFGLRIETTTILTIPNQKKNL
jgi:hypothetical protein